MDKCLVILLFAGLSYLAGTYGSATRRRISTASVFAYAPLLCIYSGAQCVFWDVVL